MNNAGVDASGAEVADLSTEAFDSDYVTGSTYFMDGGLMQNVGQGA